MSVDINNLNTLALEVIDLTIEEKKVLFKLYEENNIEVYIITKGAVISNLNPSRYIGYFNKATTIGKHIVGIGRLENTNKTLVSFKQYLTLVFKKSEIIEYKNIKIEII